MNHVRGLAPITTARLTNLRSGIEISPVRSLTSPSFFQSTTPSILFTHHPKTMAAVADKKKQKRTNAQAALSEPKAKKARLESAPTKAKSSAGAAAADKGKKRSQPVTLPLKNESDTSSDEGSEPERDDVDEMDVDDAEEEPSQAAKDPNGACAE